MNMSAILDTMALHLVVGIGAFLILNPNTCQKPKLPDLA